MPWEYLRTPELDGRVMLVAGYLASRIEGKSVVDLNCLHAPLLAFLPHTFERYIGNDIDPEAVAWLRARYSFGDWLLCSDDALPDLGRVDILVSLGFAPRVSPHESQTLDASILELVSAYRPAVVVLEMWEACPAAGSAIAIVEWCELQGYELGTCWEVKPWGERLGSLRHRRVMILERQV